MMSFVTILAISKQGDRFNIAHPYGFFHHNIMQDDGVRVEDTKSPLAKMFSGESFEISDQAFQLQESDFRDNMHVLLSIDAKKTGLSPKHHILPVRQEDLDFPMSWISSYGQGRVFYTGLGHSAPIFWNSVLLEHLLAGIQFALGDLEADTTPTPQPDLEE